MFVRPFSTIMNMYGDDMLYHQTKVPFHAKSIRLRQQNLHSKYLHCVNIEQPTTIYLFYCPLNNYSWAEGNAFVNWWSLYYCRWHFGWANLKYGRFQLCLLCHCIDFVVIFDSVDLLIPLVSEWCVQQPKITLMSIANLIYALYCFGSFEENSVDTAFQPEINDLTMLSNAKDERAIRPISIHSLVSFWTDVCYTNGWCDDSIETKTIYPTG